MNRLFLSYLLRETTSPLDLLRIPSSSANPSFLGRFEMGHSGLTSVEVFQAAHSLRAHSIEVDVDRLALEQYESQLSPTSEWLINGGGENKFPVISVHYV
jgi:hypothetical protein